MSSPRASFPLSRCPPSTAMTRKQGPASAGPGLEIRHQPGRVRPPLAGRQQRSRLSTAFLQEQGSQRRTPRDRSGDTQIPRAGLWRSIGCALRRGSRARRSLGAARVALGWSRRAADRAKAWRTDRGRSRRNADPTFNGTVVSLLPGDRWRNCARVRENDTRLPLDGTRRLTMSGN